MKVVPLRRSTPEVPEKEWVERLRRGEAMAPAALYRLHAADMLGLATRMLGNEFDADDVVHDAFIRAFERIAQFRGERFGAWLRQITLNECRARMRRERSWWRRGSELALSQSAWSEQAAPSVRAELAQAASFLRRIPADERIAWTLQRIEGMSVAEVAASVGASPATVKRRVAKAQGRLARWGASP
ncbi:MAG: RNA polymerase sigma factor [Polyangiales bacterium]